VPDMTEELRRKLVELWVKFDAGDLSALDELNRISAANKDDAGLANFVYRIREAGPGGHFVLGSK
jgi:adenylate cyclase